MKNILLGIDFDNKTGVLIKKATEVAKRYGAKIWLLHVTSPPPEYVGFDATPHYVRNEREGLLEHEQKVLREHAQDITEQGIQSEGILIQGATIDGILIEADKLDVDLIICGHHEHNFLYNMLFGSVSSSLVRKSKIPVLVFPMD